MKVVEVIAIAGPRGGNQHHAGKSRPHTRSPVRAAGQQGFWRLFRRDGEHSRVAGENIGLKRPASIASNTLFPGGVNERVPADKVNKPNGRRCCRCAVASRYCWHFHRYRRVIV